LRTGGPVAEHVPRQRWRGLDYRRSFDNAPSEPVERKRKSLEDAPSRWWHAACHEHDVLHAMHAQAVNETGYNDTG